VRILLHDTNQRRVGRSTAIADAAGHFRFPDLAPGVYHLDAQQGGYLPVVYNSGSAVAMTEAITLSAGQRVKDLEIRLTPAATITGTVLDRRNRIVARARVGIEETRRDGATLRIVRADSRGRFRIGLLPPGRYRITAELDPATTPPSSSPNSEERLGGRILSVRNRGGVAPAVVVVVEVQAGEELSDVQVLLPASGCMVRLALT
jgi:protocatechuate 3,4-dioxygenase beta subunit